MHGKLNNLDGGVVAGRDGGVGRQGHLWQAHRARVGVLAGPQDLEGRDHGEAHVPGAIVGTVGAEAHVNVEEGGGVALEPARLEGDGAACCGPVCAVCCCWVAAACGGRWYVSLFVPRLFALAGCEAGRLAWDESRYHRGLRTIDWIWRWWARRLTWVHPLHAEGE